MVTFVGFLMELGASIVEMIRLFTTDVALYDPLSTVSLVVGTLLMAFTMGFFGYLVLGAAGELVGIGSAR